MRPCMPILADRHWTHMHFVHVRFGPLGDVALERQPHLWGPEYDRFYHWTYPFGQL